MLFAVLAGVTLNAATFAASATAQETPASSPSVEPLLETDATVLGQPLAYPAAGEPRVTAAVITMAPGVDTGLHRHEVPLFAHVLTGELTVTYDGAGERIYRMGDSLMEAIGTPHNGRNNGTAPVRILVVFMGSAEAANTVPMN
jgi:quercetin dioxygenase-like cupin family protein